MCGYTTHRAWLIQQCMKHSQHFLLFKDEKSCICHSSTSTFLCLPFFLSFSFSFFSLPSLFPQYQGHVFPISSAKLHLNCVEVCLCVFVWIFRGWRWMRGGVSQSRVSCQNHCSQLTWFRHVFPWLPRVTLIRGGVSALPNLTLT